MSQETSWTQFSLTHLEYPSGDYFGFVLCLFSLLPLAVIVAFATLILFRRDLHTIFLFVGVCGCEVLNLTLKHWLKQERPTHGRSTNLVRYGMPSSHAQLSTFLATYLLFFLLVRLQPTPSQHCVTRWWRHLLAIFSCSCALLVSYSRVYLGYHSAWQVVCGAAVGVCVGLMWFLFVHVLCTPLFPDIARWRVCELLLICDTSLIPSILWFEYTHKQMEARARRRRSYSSNKLQ